MEFSPHQSFPIADPSYLSSVKRSIAKLAFRYGFDEKQRGKIDIAVSEMASNLVKHATAGQEVLVKPIHKAGQIGIEILSLDNGPGMHSPSRMMEDGVSTYGSLGQGLGAIRRLSDEFGIYSQPGVGTVVLFRLYQKSRKKPAAPPKEPCDIGVVMVAKTGETVCGDGWAAVEQKDRCIVLAVDGLGHGREAHMAATEAIRTFVDCMECIPSNILRLMHASIRQTRGVVGGIASFDLKGKSVSFSGIGNIAARILSGDSAKGVFSYHGTIGHNIPATINNHSFPWEASTIFILHSDGLKTRWDFPRYPGLQRQDPSIIAAVLYKDNARMNKDNTRKTDDNLVIVVKAQET